MPNNQDNPDKNRMPATLEDGSKDGKKDNPWRFAGLGLEIAGIMAVCSLLGWRIDQHFQHRVPYIMIMGLIAAFGGRMYLLFKETKPWR